MISYQKVPSTGGGGASQTEADWGELPTLANYQDAKTAGSATGVTFAMNSNNDAISIDTHLNELGVGIVAGTNRAQGILREVPAGDFVYMVRVAFERLNSSGVSQHIEGAGSSTASVLAMGSVFVDGSDPESSSWFGLHKYLGNGETHDFYAFDNQAGAARFETYDASYTAMSTSYESGTVGTAHDYIIKRVGTDLFMGECEPGGTVVWRTKTTVSGANGLVGVRSQTILAETDYLNVFILKDYLGDTVFPY